MLENLSSMRLKPIFHTMVPIIADAAGKSEAWVYEMAESESSGFRGDWRSSKELLTQWKACNQEEEDEAWLYGDNRYILEGLTSYLFWARDYVRRIDKLIPLLNEKMPSVMQNIKTFVDFGAGIGLSTLHLQQVLDKHFPGQIEVVYHNVVSATSQNKIAQQVLAGSSVKICIQDEIPPGEAFLMSELLEHIRAPVSFVSAVIKEANPVMLMHASTFSDANSPGHFTHYDCSQHGDRSVMRHGKKTSRHVNSTIRNAGYTAIQTPILWNSRPYTLIRNDILPEVDGLGSSSIRI
jgi:hypothetical protein